MKAISRYTKKQLLNLAIVFLICAALIIWLEYHQEKRYRIRALNRELNGYAGLISNYINRSATDSLADLNRLIRIIPNKNLHVTIIDLAGKVVFDTRVNDPASMENHLTRPEIQKTIADTAGSDIRISATTGIKYYYYAKLYPPYFIRLSVEYRPEIRRMLKPDATSAVFIFLLFSITSLSLVIMTARFGKSMAVLRKFTQQASEDHAVDDLHFPSTELGHIGQDIVEIYQKLNFANQKLVSEKEKLVRHLNILEEGIAIFTREKKVIINNGNFIQCINHISDQLVYSAENIFSIPDFRQLLQFIDRNLNDNLPENPNQPAYEVTINRNGKFYVVKCILFQDQSFEVIIRDDTKTTKRKILKHQITENIAHELKTPVSSIKGFLETVIDNKVDRGKMMEFIRRAYSQTCRLTDLINDLSLLTKIEEAGNLYPIESVNILNTIEAVIEDLQGNIDENGVTIRNSVTENIEINGNQVLIYSIFRNLVENTVNHAGKGVTIMIDKYLEDSSHYYFSYSDTGTGVPQSDLPRLFERFYRVDKGRDRKSGGTGLGLSIVKNAIQFHKGEISAKNRKDGGLEFLFTLSRDTGI